MEQTRLVDRLAVSTAEAAELLGVSRPLVCQLLHRADFPSFCVGARRLIPLDGLRAWMAAQMGGINDGE